MESCHPACGQPSDRGSLKEEEEEEDLSGRAGTQQIDRQTDSDRQTLPIIL